MWEDDFANLLFSNDPTRVNAKEAAELKYNKFPSHLYKYRTFDENEYSVKALEEDKIFLSNPLEFNDPYDCALLCKDANYVKEDFLKNLLAKDPKGFRKAHNLTKKQISKLQKSDKIIKDLSIFIAKNSPEYKNNPKRLNELSKENELQIRAISADFNELRKDMLVSCFSEDYKSILMWSHYAKEHTGFCVEYDFKSLGHNNHLTRNLFPVLYANEIFTIDDYIYNPQPQFPNILSSYLEGIDLNKIMDGIQFEILGNNKYNNMFPVCAALTKYEGWKYEKEWRYVLYSRNESKSTYINVPKPTAIYLGTKSNKKDIILEIANNKNIDVYQMQMKSSDYALEAEKIL
ncbi:hypothetical protein Metbo_2154 [Methanobacterium lacus]|uniref:DUF2971 domain-containing protein n=1 Tax=Methanobacterium lacus (strain AL-21) TaxID=877455 RepID=F0TCA2_METLA|nr:DUF2971 domain-containing protein [Methanobacterium lacus]ADZ10369.1 hypothetical protein Metbo_2154 [Methanobacterium lacus]